MQRRGRKKKEKQNVEDGGEREMERSSIMGRIGKLKLKKKTK